MDFYRYFRFLNLGKIVGSGFLLPPPRFWIQFFLLLLDWLLPKARTRSTLLLFLAHNWGGMKWIHAFPKENMNSTGDAGIWSLHRRFYFLRWLALCYTAVSTRTFCCCCSSSSSRRQYCSSSSIAIVVILIKSKENNKQPLKWHIRIEGTILHSSSPRVVHIEWNFNSLFSSLNLFFVVFFFSSVTLSFFIFPSVSLICSFTLFQDHYFLFLSLFPPLSKTPPSPRLESASF